jgi:hypothetical protein
MSIYCIAGADRGLEGEAKPVEQVVVSFGPTVAARTEVDGESALEIRVDDSLADRDSRQSSRLLVLTVIARTRARNRSRPLGFPWAAVRCHRQFCGDSDR